MGIGDWAQSPLNKQINLILIYDYFNYKYIYNKN